jgi:hypothetical protein
MGGGTGWAVICQANGDVINVRRLLIDFGI